MTIVKTIFALTNYTYTANRFSMIIVQTFSIAFGFPYPVSILFKKVSGPFRQVTQPLAAIRLHDV